LRWLGVWRGAAFALVAVASARVAMQVWLDPEPRIWAGTVVIAAWGWAMLGLLRGSRPAAGLGLLLGIAADVAVRTALVTIDTGWMPDTTRMALTVAVALVLAIAAAAIWSGPHAEPGAERSGVALLAVGPALGLYHLAGGNFGWVAQRLSSDFPVTAAVVAAGGVGGLALVALDRRFGARAGASRLLLLLPVAAAGLAASSLFGLAGILWLLGMALFSDRTPARGVERRPVLWFTVGMLLQAAMIFVYFSATGDPFYRWPLLALAFVGAMAGVPWRRLDLRDRVLAALVTRGVVVAIVLLALVTGVTAARWENPAGSAVTLSADVTVMTYNIQNGFSRDNVFDLEGIARTIEAENPDIVVLQEVARGWLATSATDNLLWLSRRLEMEAVFGPASDDGLWGNAVLTRGTILGHDQIVYSVSDNFDRSALRVRIATEAGDLTVIVTHLDNPAGADAIRDTQTAELLAFWGGEGRTVIGGDFNADPDSATVRAMIDAGFVDAGAALGPDAITSEDDRRIDYLFVTGDLLPSEPRIPGVWTSDHLPFAIRVSSR
jgi:endonuclease/exonuclease/phosphatase family metal-dependent hydrolase